MATTKRKISLKGIPMTRDPYRKTAPAMARMKMLSLIPKLFTLRRRGVARGSTSASILLIFPISVFSPVDITMALAVPETTIVPE